MRKTSRYYFLTILSLSLVGYFFTITSAVAGSSDSEISISRHLRFQAVVNKFNALETVFFEIDEKEEEESERLSFKKTGNHHFLADELFVKALRVSLGVELSLYQFQTYLINVQPIFLLLRVLRL